MTLFHRNKQTQLVRPYYSNNIGLSSLGNEFCYEFLILGKHNNDHIQNKILGVFLDKNTRVLSMNSAVNKGKKEFTLTLLCNLEGTDTDPEGLALLLRKLDSVTRVEYQELKGRLYGRSFPLTLYNKRRAVALRSSTIIKLGVHLARETGSLGTSVLFDEGRNYAFEVIEEMGLLLRNSKESVAYDNYEIEESKLTEEAFCVKCKEKREIQNPRQVVLNNGKPAIQGICPVCSTRVFKIGFKTFPKIRNSALLENVQGFLLATGWGAFELRSEMDGKFGSVTVLDPPTYESSVSCGNQFVEGIASGLLEATSKSKNKLTLLGENYDPANRILSLYFAEKIPALARESVVREQPKRAMARVEKKAEKREERKEKKMENEKVKRKEKEEKKRKEEGEKGKEKKKKIESNLEKVKTEIKQEATEKKNPDQEIKIDTASIQPKAVAEKEKEEEEEKKVVVEEPKQEENPVEEELQPEEENDAVEEELPEEEDQQFENIIRTLEQIATETKKAIPEISEGDKTEEDN